MPIETNNPFRSVALILISLTIIVLGVVYNQTTSQGKAETTTVAPSGANATDTLSATPQSTAPTTSTNNSTSNPSQNTISVPAMPDFEQLNNSLALIGQLAKLSAISFAYNNLDIKLPGIGITPIPSTGGMMPEVPTLETNPAPSIAPTITTSPTPTPTSSTNQIVPFLKSITGYSQWEQFKTQFREAEQKYAGTGKCMINIAGLGCLATW